MLNFFFFCRNCKLILESCQKLLFNFLHALKLPGDLMFATWEKPNCSKTVPVLNLLFFTNIFFVQALLWNSLLKAKCTCYIFTKHIECYLNLKCKSIKSFQTTNWRARGFIAVCLYQMFLQATEK